MGLDELNRLIEHPEQLQEMKDNEKSVVFVEAARKGNQPILEKLESITPHIDKLSIRDISSILEYNARQNVPTEFWKYLFSKIPGTKWEQILSYKNSITAWTYFISARYNRSAQLKFMEDYAAQCIENYRASPDLIYNMLSSGEKYSAFEEALKENHVDTFNNLVDKLNKIAPKRLPDLVQAISDDTFAIAFSKNYAPLSALEAMAPEKFLEKMETITPKILIQTLANGHVHLLENLKEKLPNKHQEFIRKCNFNFYPENSIETFLEITRSGNAVAFKYLEKELTEIDEEMPFILKAMVEEKDFQLFHEAVKSEHTGIINHLLSSYPSVLGYAEGHSQFKKYIDSFITEEIKKLITHHADEKNQKLLAERCFYILRNLIRRNDETTLDDISHLLAIPAVRDIVYVDMGRGENELLREALSANNKKAAALLLNIPEVAERAREKNGYHEEMKGIFDIANVVKDPNSAMRILTPGEQQRLQGAIDRYSPIIQEQGVNTIISDLKGKLIIRYYDKPAVLEVQRGAKKVSIPLPLNWNAFIKATNDNQLSPAEYREALKKYYAHPDHTALRYLSKPNLWMQQNAFHTEQASPGSGLWSTFETYLPLISTLYLAAIDKNEEMAPIDGFTVEHRLDFFISQLAYLGRAHNFDKGRDDAEGDKPECFEGVKRILLYAVPGHPLLKLLTEEILALEIKNFLNKHYMDTIATLNTTQIKKYSQAFYDCVYNMEDSAVPILKELNIPSQKVDMFKIYLGKKYGTQFSKDKELEDYVKRQFQKDCHLMVCDVMDISKLFERPDSNVSSSGKMLQYLNSSNETKNHAPANIVNKNTHAHEKRRKPKKPPIPKQKINSAEATPASTFSRHLNKT